MAKGNHSFTEQDIHSRFNAIVGHTVAEVDTAGVLTASSASRNKGRVGAVIERSVLGYPADSDSRPDILIDGQPWEVKVTGLVEVARGGWRAKEPMSITAVAPEGIVAESFTTSAFWHKAARLLVVYYLYVRPGRGVAVEYAGFEFKGYDLHTWREVDRCRLEADWTLVRDFVRTALGGDVDTEMPNLSTLVNPHLLYLDTSPKWPNRPRFRLKASLVTQMARERLDDGMRMIPDQGGLSSMNALKAHLHEIAETYGGQTLEELAAPFNLPLKAKSGKENKSLTEQVVVRLFTGHAGKISQVPLFAKAGLVFKTMTLTPAGVMAKAFPAVYPDETDELDVLPDPYENSTRFGVGQKVSQFKNAGVMQGCHVLTCDFAEDYRGERRVLGDVLVDESDVPEQFYIAEEKLPDWRYLKGAKREERTNKKTGFTYTYSEGAMSFPDSIEKPSRTILTGEGGTGASRFKHVIECPDGRFRRLVPDELDQLQGFPKGWTDTGMTDGHRAFCMGNALVTGVPHRIGEAMVEVYGL